MEHDPPANDAVTCCGDKLPINLLQVEFGLRNFACTEKNVRIPDSS